MFTPDQQQLIKDKLPEYLKADADFAAIYHKVRADFDASGLPAHNWDHIFHDVCNAIVIGEAEQADMHIVLPAIAMHDIGFLYEGTSRTHGAIGADRLREYIEHQPLSYSDAELDHIAACIRTHKKAALTTSIQRRSRLKSSLTPIY